MNIQLNVEMLRVCFEVTVISFVLMVLAAPKVIPVLHRMKFGQEVRDDGPESHLKKQGTPTMGGAIFLPAMILSCLIGFAAMKKADPDAIKVLFLTFGFGFTGFLDDFLKIRRHNSKGLKAWQKLALQFIIALAFTVWAYGTEETPGRVYIPFTGYGETALFFDLPGWLFVPFALFVILGTDNGVNFTDGLDGLCSSVTCVVSVFFLVTGLLLSEGVSLVAASCLGALMGFLLFNAYPAKIFMGDTGSLALGGFVAACAIVTGSELYIVIVGFIYMAEVISVIIQVLYFKATHGKRFFKMAPIHHHFELCGNSETRIVTAFTIITVILAGLSVTGFLYIR